MVELRKGLDEVRKAQERAKNRASSGGSRNQTNFFTWKSDQEEKVLRFLTDIEDIYILNTHFTNKTIDNRYKSLICREEFGESCELCAMEDKPRELGYGLAVLRDEVFDESGSVVTGYKDYTEEREIEENGSKSRKIVPFVGIVNQNVNTFWGGITAIYKRFGSLKSYDIAIQRQGEGFQRQYIACRLEPVEIPDIDARYAKYMPDLKDYLEYIGSEKYYDRALRGMTKEQPIAGSFPTDTDSEFEKIKQQQEKLASTASGGSYE